MYMAERALRTLAEMVEIEDAELHDAVDGVDRADGDDDVDDRERALGRGSSRYAIGTMAKSTSCLQSMKLVAGSTEKTRRDERRAGVGRERPEHPRHFDALAVAR